MNRPEILKALDMEITRLQQARTLLAEAPDLLPEPARRGPGRPKGSGTAAAKPSGAPAGKRNMSAEGKARIAAAQKARWAKVHRTARKAQGSNGRHKTVAKTRAKKTVKKTASKKVVAKKAVASPEPAA